MAVVTFTAQSSLPAGIIAGDAVSIQIKRTDYDQEIKTERTVHRSMSGKTKTTLHRRDREWSIGAIFTTKEGCEMMFCFLDSCLGGADFVFDVSATMSGKSVVAGVPVTCKLIDDSVKPRRLSMRADAFDFSFKIRDNAQPVSAVKL